MKKVKQAKKYLSNSFEIVHEVMPQYEERFPPTKDAMLAVRELYTVIDTYLETFLRQF